MADRMTTGGTLVLDSEGLAKLAAGDAKARAFQDLARRQDARIVVSALTLTEVLRGGKRDASVHRMLKRLIIVPVSEQIGRQAGELLGETGMSGHRCAIDAVVAATALCQQRPVVLLTSDLEDMKALVEEPSSSKAGRIVVEHI